MSQISPPIRILLVLTVAVLGVYMLFLRPKPEEIPPVEPVGTSVTDAPGIAQDAVDAANGQLAQQESVDGVDAGEAAAATKSGKPGSAQARAAATPAEDLKGLPKPIRKAIRADKTLVILFSNGRSYDDKAVEQELANANRWDGDVFVHTAPLRRISRYGRIARGVNVEQSPTIVVADSDLRAETLVGFVDRFAIDQAVVDARRNSSGIYTDAYLKQVDKVCFAHSNRFDSIPFMYLSNSSEADRRYAEADRVWASFTADFKAVKPSAKWRSFHNAALADFQARGALIHRNSVLVTPTMKRPALAAAWRNFATSEFAIIKRTRARFNGANLPRCGRQF